MRHPAVACELPAAPPKRGSYRPWAELLKRTLHFDVLTCPNCQGRMRLLAVLTEDREVRRYLRGIGEATELPNQAPARGPNRARFEDASWETKPRSQADNADANIAPKRTCARSRKNRPAPQQIPATTY
jgi:uncharacterized protein YbaR (Trm112 family)